MTKRAKIELPDLDDIKPFTKAKKGTVEELSAIGLQNGFTARHNLETKRGGGRRRRSLKTARLTLALEPRVRDDFWALADKLNEDGGELLGRLIEHYVNSEYV